MSFICIMYVLCYVSPVYVVSGISCVWRVVLVYLVSGVSCIWCVVYLVCRVYRGVSWCIVVYRGVSCI